MRISTRIWLLGALAAGGLLVALATLLSTEYAQWRRAQRNVLHLDAARTLSVVVNEMQAERGQSVGYLASSPGDSDAALRQQFRKLDAAFEAAATYDPDYGRRPAAIGELRELTLQRAVSPDAAYADYTTAVSAVMDDLVGVALGGEHGASQQRLYAFVSLMQAKEYLGQARATKLQALVRQRSDTKWLVTLSQRLALFDDRLRRFAANADPDSRSALDDEALARSLRETRQLIAMTLGRASVQDVGDDASAARWFDVASEAVNALHRLDLQMLQRMSDAVGERATRLRDTMLLKAAMLVAIWTALTLLVFTLLRQLLLWLSTLLDNLRLIGGHGAARVSGEDDGRALVGAFRTLVDKIDHLNIEAASDPLTGLLNRRGLAQTAAPELQRAQRYARELSALMVDVDLFKQINDRHGHATGDALLHELAGVMRERARTTDLIGRWGGEEFLLLLPETDPAQASILAEELRERVAAHRFSKHMRITVSVGVAAFASGDTLDSLCARADEALYRAKQAGRNAVREHTGAQHRLAFDPVR